MKPELLKQLEEALKESDGIGTDDELASSINALKSSMSESRQGKTRPFTEALDDLIQLDH